MTSPNVPDTVEHLASAAHHDDARFMVFIPDFTAYGNQPKVHAIATEVRSSMWLMRIKKKQRMRHSSEANGLGRVSGRISAVKDGAWFCASPVRKAGRSWFSLAPKSPAAHWLARQDFQQFPF